jgi:hypothetical protein
VLSRLDIAGNQTPNQLSNQPIKELFEATAADEMFFLSARNLLQMNNRRMNPYLIN